MADKETAATASPAPVDETPISPSRPNPGRKNSLEQHLMHRPERHELVEKNILPASNAAPGLQAHQKEIAHRPSPEALLKEGVLHEDPRSAEEKYAEAMEEEYAKREGGA
ncbi:hypothetical protein QBC37DRAFT_432932 [Rhypophila decipiens]|uniref:RPEL repeat protein n=1 Tax=Rhypophila decipiens TaxID=261697 RepID=A0AAN7B032_9PEZI|nr:hypothetical protein QBC37DRAFT_432932 [Rhypophila decipiens]